MNKLLNTLWALSLTTTIACSGQSITGPSAGAGQPAQSLSTSATPAVGNADNSGPSGDTTPTPTPAPGSGLASSPQYSIQGQTDCVPAGSDVMRWVLNMIDAGPSPLRFVALSHHSGALGCGHTVENPRARVDIVGALNYAKHAAGQTTFAFEPRNYNCGRV
ncbi:MAG: hypothetical protein FJW27_02790 [Acidimicrobiia bacterium]|nr:hypothetical protein [Acidimicrobiia bacterium]